MRLSGSICRAVATAAAVTLWMSAPVLAIDDAPARPKIDCTKAKNKKKPACKPRAHETLGDEELVNAAYWMAREGQYGDALALLAQAKDQNNPRVLNVTGFATRKLGNVDSALEFYTRALEIKPDYVQAREYMGEAYLSKGDIAHAAEQLGEIERRCGKSCVSYAELARQIKMFEAAQVRGS